MKLAVLTAIWKRPALTELMLRETGPLFDLCLAVGSEGAKSRDCAESAGFEYIEAPNKPLSDKWSTGMQALRGRADAVLSLGSDDFVSPEVVLAAREAMKTAPFFGFLDLYLVGYGPKAYYTSGYKGRRAGESVGVARTLSAELLDKISWAPWPRGLSRGLDYGMMQRVHSVLPLFHKPKLVRMAEVGGRIFDAKTQENVNPLHTCLEGYSEADIQGLFTHFSPGLLEKLDPLMTASPPRPPRPAKINPPAPPRVVSKAVPRHPIRRGQPIAPQSPSQRPRTPAWLARRRPPPPPRPPRR